MIAQVAEALAAAHSVGVLHKDVKPQNVLIAEDAEGKSKARLADFGVGLVRDKSVLVGRDFTVTGFTETTKDANRNGGGTRLYAAPELLEGRTPTTLADIYALGVMLYQVVVGDLERALAPGWERDAADDLLKHDISACVEGRPERRLGNALNLAERLRSLKQRRTQSEAPHRRRRNRRVWMAASSVAVIGFGVALFNLGERVAERPVQFNRITFQRTAVANARFSADGGTVIYNRWGDHPDEIFSMRLDSIESRSLGLHARVAAAAPGEMAVILPNGTLARLPMDGGVPREIVEHVVAADWAPDGSLAVLHGRPSSLRIEFPLGRQLYDAGSITFGENLRVSPRGDRVAFIEHPYGHNFDGFAPGPGHLVVLDRRGQKLVSSEWTSIGGLAWSPDGNEVWFTATKTSFASALHALSVAGRERLVAQMPETIYLHDISRDGRVLVAQGRVSAEARGRMALDAAERDYTWLDGTTRARFSPDGRFFIFTEAIEGGGPVRRAYLRRTDGAPPVWLGNGTALDVSPDGKWWCLSGLPSELRLVRAGAGEPRTLRRGMIDPRGYSQALLLPDGKRLVGVGSAVVGHDSSCRRSPMASRDFLRLSERSARPQLLRTVDSLPLTRSVPIALCSIPSTIANRIPSRGSPLAICPSVSARMALRCSSWRLLRPRETENRAPRHRDRKEERLAGPPAAGRRGNHFYLQGRMSRNIDLAPDGRSYLYSYCAPCPTFISSTACGDYTAMFRRPPRSWHIGHSPARDATALGRPESWRGLRCHPIRVVRDAKINFPIMTDRRRGRKMAKATRERLCGLHGCGGGT